MLARLTIAPIPAEKTDEVERVFRDAIGPAPRDVKGFRGGYALTDRELVGLVSTFFSGEPELKTYEVTVEMPAALHV